jgi:threonine dehydratase
MSTFLTPPGRSELVEARARVERHAHRTPVLTSSYFDHLIGASLFFKCENFQKVGAFKFRGACNAVFSLSPEELERGVVAHSSGNHAQALALAARLRGTRATIVMPENATAIKVAAVRDYGADVVLCQPTQESREGETARIVEETGASLIHPFNDSRIVAGQSTAAQELLEDVDALDMILAPVGGGGLLSGCALAAHHYSPKVRIVGAEPAAADDAARSLQEGHILPALPPTTIADGLLTSLGELTFSILRDHVEQIVTVEEAAIVEAMRAVWERMKILIEPSSAVPVAALLKGDLEVHGKRVGVILSGGNVDLDRLPWQA